MFSLFIAVVPRGIPPRNALTASLVVPDGPVKRSLSRVYRRSLIIIRFTHYNISFAVCSISPSCEYKSKRTLHSQNPFCFVVYCIENLHPIIQDIRKWRLLVPIKC